MNLKKILMALFSVALTLGLLYPMINIYIKTHVEPSETFIQAVSLSKSEENIHHLHNTFTGKNEKIEKSKEEIDPDNELIYYNQLNDTEKEIYWMVDYSINNFDYLVIDFSDTEFGEIYNNSDNDKKINSSFLEFDDSVNRAEMAYYYDNPEIYWADISQFVEIIDNYYIADYIYNFSKKTTGYTEKELNAFLDSKQDFDNKLNAISTEISNKTSSIDNDWGKALYISKWICDNTNYNYSVLSETNVKAKMMNGGIYSAVTNNTSVCRGYTELYKYLLDYVGINNQQCTGNVDEAQFLENVKESTGTEIPGLSGDGTGENHIWNVVEINGELCNIDVTSIDQTDNIMAYDFAYFGASDKQLEKSHTKKGIFSGGKCESTNNSFFIHENLYSVSLTKESIENAIEYAIQNNYKFAFVQYANPQDAENANIKYMKNSLTLQNILFKYNKQYDEIITIDEKQTYETAYDPVNGIFYIVL